MLRLRIRGVELRVTFWFLAFVSLALGAADTSAVGMFALFSLAHELGHLTALVMCGAMPGYMLLSLGRFEIGAATDGLPRRQQAAVLVCGPLVNFALAGAFAVFGKAVPVRINLFLALINCLPAAHLDGGQLAALALLPRFGKKGEWSLSTLSFLCGALVCAIGIISVCMKNGNPTALLFGIYLLISTLREQNAYTNDA
ncbi:MAG: hypothetical protein RR998_03815 [Oscillospiraceae bacterium]